VVDVLKDRSLNWRSKQGSRNENECIFRGGYACFEEDRVFELSWWAGMKNV